MEKKLNLYSVSYCPASCPSIRKEVRVRAYNAVRAEGIVMTQVEHVVGGSVVVTYIRDL